MTRSEILKNAKKGEIYFTEEGIIYNSKLFKMSKVDMEWVKKENKNNPTLHPARDLSNLATTIYKLI